MIFSKVVPAFRKEAINALVDQAPPIGIRCPIPWLRNNCPSGFDAVI